MIGHDEICAMIPHAGSMCLLDSVEQWDEQSIVCQSRSHTLKSNPLRKNHQLSAVHAIEYGAQAMAVHGCLLARARGETLKPGYLAALKEVQLHLSRLDDLGEPLIISAQQLIAAGGNLMYTVSIRCADQEVASARATVVTQSVD